MSDKAALLAAIRAKPDENTPRLMFADCLEENGEADRALAIRVLTDPADFMPPEAGRVVSDLEWRETVYYTVSEPERRAAAEERETLWRDERERRRCLTPRGFSHFLQWRERSRLDEILNRGIAVGRLAPRFDRGLLVGVGARLAEWLAYGDGVYAEHPVRTVDLDAQPALEELVLAAPGPERLCYITGDRQFRRFVFHESQVQREAVSELRLTLGVKLPGLLERAALRLRWPGVLFSTDSRYRNLLLGFVKVAAAHLGLPPELVGPVPSGQPSQAS